MMMMIMMHGRLGTSKMTVRRGAGLTNQIQKLLLPRGRSCLVGEDNSGLVDVEFVLVLD